MQSKSFILNAVASSISPANVDAEKSIFFLHHGCIIVFHESGLVIYVVIPLINN